MTEAHWKEYLESWIEEMMVHGPSLTPQQRKEAVANMVVEVARMQEAEKEFEELLKTTPNNPNVTP